MPLSKLVDIKTSDFRNSTNPVLQHLHVYRVLKTKMGGYEMHVLHRSCLFSSMAKAVAQCSGIIFADSVLILWIQIESRKTATKSQNVIKCILIVGF